MAEASIPVDVFNPGQVFACLGFLEAADILLGDAEGGFDWSNDSDVRFAVRSNGNDNPFSIVLGFLAETEIRRYAPPGYSDPAAKKKKSTEDGDEEIVIPERPPELSEAFPNHKVDRMALPIRLVGPAGGQVCSLTISHWADASSRNDFKLYSGNRSAGQIACAMLRGTREKSKKKAKAGDVKTRGVDALWMNSREDLTAKPFDVLTVMGGSFNFDARGAWTAIDAGYSPNDQKHLVVASPVVEILAAIGLEHARPDEYDTRQVRYGIWSGVAPLILARPALAGAKVAFHVRRFRFTLDLSGKNKVATFAEEEVIV